MRNATLISWLNIGEEEQRMLTTIIGADEKGRRKRKRDREAYRKKHGSATREDYLHAQTEKTKRQLWRVKKAINRYPRMSNRKIGLYIGVSESYIRKLRKKHNF
ncbi:MAG: hypothetical protein ACI35R_13360 [Bacillus sp. (in: firmicutes)]